MIPSMVTHNPKLLKFDQIQQLQLNKEFDTSAAQLVCNIIVYDVIYEHPQGPATRLITISICSFLDCESLAVGSMARHQSDQRVACLIGEYNSSMNSNTRDGPVHKSFTTLNIIHYTTFTTFQNKLGLSCAKLSTASYQLAGASFSASCCWS